MLIPDMTQLQYFRICNPVFILVKAWRKILLKVFKSQIKTKSN